MFELKTPQHRPVQKRLLAVGAGFSSFCCYSHIVFGSALLLYIWTSYFCTYVTHTFILPGDQPRLRQPPGCRRWIFFLGTKRVPR